MTRCRVRQDNLHEYSEGSNWSDGESSSNEDEDKEVFDVETDNDGNTMSEAYKSFKESAFDGEDYSTGSTVLLDGIEDLWNQAFASVTLAFLNSFFDWLLSQRTGKDGRKKRGTTKSSSLGTYWKVYRLVYERATGEKLDAKLNRKMHKEILTATVTIPEVLFDLSLTLSVQTFLLGILFRHRAFEAPSLTCPERLTQLDIYPGEQELPIPLKASMKDNYIFRRAIKTLVGYEMSSNKLISYGMMAGWIKRCSEIAGMEVPTIPYNLRYNAGNEFDRSNEVSDATRNLLLDHANSTPFQRHYLGRQIHRPFINKRRPVDLTAEQAASINLHPTIKQLARRVEELRQRRKRSRGAMDEYKDAVRKLRSEKQRLKRALKQQIRDEWTDKQAVVDIEAQLNGLGLVGDSTVEASNCPMRPAQKRLVGCLDGPS
ncbi:hypothetical protein B0T17DRAFT_620503 [Bombardia bombarda]|uniref:Uncharacterized protein n=1 Tax=Bombardia bombarda TaxID=252184 RepID=A0AA39WCB7_9PEZI|nr:hypothetical protein B0T17DRAFT_620503 [Bombardia bombarda]